MYRLGKFISCVLLIILPKVVLSLKDVVLDIQPRVVQLGEASTLRCSYNLEDAPLYSVKWYRGNFEFYRYTPKEHPSTKIFPLTGIHVDYFPANCNELNKYKKATYRGCRQRCHFSKSANCNKSSCSIQQFFNVQRTVKLKKSNEHQVVLTEVGFNLSGQFTCEVTADAPPFSTVAVSKDMLVVVLPNYTPTLNTDKSFYDIGDVLRANCSSSPSRPAATLTYILNNIVVCEKCVTRKHAAQELWWSELSLELPLFPSNFNNGRLTLKCVAEIGDLYQQDTEISLYNVKDPVPARVTQSSAVYYQVKIFCIGFVVLLVFTS